MRERRRWKSEDARKEDKKGRVKGMERCEGRQKRGNEKKKILGKIEIRGVGEMKMEREDVRKGVWQRR